MTNARLKVLSGNQEGSEIPLPEGKFLIGREEDCHLRPNSELVSRHHCVFARDEYALRLRDLGSTNGTFVNDQPLRGGVVLNSGDRVRVGQLEFEVVLGDAADAPEVPDVGDLSDDTSTVNAAETATEIPAAAPASDTVYAPGPGQPQPGQAPPPGYPMQYPMYGYPGYPPAYPGYYQMPYPQPGQPVAAPVVEGPPADDSSVPDVRLPDPETTGAKPPEAKSDEGSSEQKGEQGETVPDTAEKIIRQYLQRRPTTG